MDKTSTKQGITRRDFVRMAGITTGMAAVGAGIEGVLASRRAPAFAKERSLHFLLWKNFSPPADVEILRQGAEWGKQHNDDVKKEMRYTNDIQCISDAETEGEMGRV